MTLMQHTGVKPYIAIIDPNTLAVLGLKHILQSVMPVMQVDTYGSFAELQANHPERYFHYFVEMRIVLANMQFFIDNRHKTIVLSPSASGASGLDRFHSICVNLPEKKLVRAILAMEQHAHAKGRNLPQVQTGAAQHSCDLSQREIEVLSLVAKGCINKQIADVLNISLPTVVTHRKNVMDKLGLRSVSALTIYAVMHGYVGIGDI